MATDYIPLAEAARLIPGKPSHVSVWRWARYGVKTRDGSTVRLEHVRYGSRLFTTAEAVRTFGEKLATADAGHFSPGQATPPTNPTLARSPARRDREVSAARLRLKEAGIG